MPTTISNKIPDVLRRPQNSAFDLGTALANARSAETERKAAVDKQAAVVARRFRDDDTERTRDRALAATARRSIEQRAADQERIRGFLADYLANPALEGDRAVLPPMPLDRPVL